MMVTKLKTEEIEELFKSLEAFRKELNEKDMTFQNLDETIIKLREKYNSFKGQLATYRAFYNEKQQTFTQIEKAIKNAGVKLEEDPFEDYIKTLDDMNMVLTEMYTWVFMFLKIFDVYSFKLEQALKTAHGLNLTKEVMDRYLRFAEEIKKSESERFETMVTREREMFEKMMGSFLKRVEWSDRMFETIAKAVGKDKDAIIAEYKAISRTPKEKISIEPKEEKLDLPKKTVSDFITKKKEYVCENCNKSFGGEFLLIEHIDKEHRGS